MLCLQGYFTICYCPGKEMVIPDTLSWFSPQPGPDLPLNITIHHTHIMPDCKQAFQQAFVNDPEMQALANLIVTGWPKDIKEVPHPLHPYWQHRETLTIKDGLVLWGEALVIPPAKRERVLHQLHQFHQGITKSQLLTCGSFFWSGINKAIKEVVLQCEAWTWFQSQNAVAPLTPTPTPLCPWQMCATDIFMLEGIDHLLVGDFYSKMILVQCLPPGKSNTNKVISLLKEMFSEHGIPKSFALTMAHNMRVPSLPTSVYLGAYHTKPQVCITHNPMDLPRHASSLSNMHSNEPNTVVLIHTLPYYHSKLHQLTPSFHLQQSCCTNADSEQPFWLRYTIVTHQLHKSMSRLTHALKLLNHRLTNAAKHLCHCMLVNQLQCMTPSERFGFLLLWYTSYHGSAIKYTPTMVPHTAVHGDTFVNAVSRQLTLSQVAQLPHSRLW